VDFHGAPNHVHCFMHILNLVVKSIMHQFDVPRKRSDIIDKSTHNDIEVKELKTKTENEDYQEETEEAYSDNDKGWIDEQDNMAEKDLDDLDNSVQPI
jgi:hypothetical protein